LEALKEYWILRLGCAQITDRPSPTHHSAHLLLRCAAGRDAQRGAMPQQTRTNRLKSNGHTLVSDTDGLLHCSSSLRRIGYDPMEAGGPSSSKHPPGTSDAVLEAASSLPSAPPPRARQGRTGSCPCDMPAEGGVRPAPLSAGRKQLRPARRASGRAGAAASAQQCMETLHASRAHPVSGPKQTRLGFILFRVLNRRESGPS
jgi:hypothetical protein